MTITVRLGDELEKKLSELSRRKMCNKSQIIKESLNGYLEKQLHPATPYELGADLFGQVGSGISHLSKKRKQILKRKVRAKNIG